jgi:hypothetical protein
MCKLFKLNYKRGFKMWKITILIYIIIALLTGIGFILLGSKKSRFSYYTNRNKAFGYFVNLMDFAKKMDFKKASRQRKVEKEIYEGISFMRNILTLNAGKQIRGDVIIEKLANRSGVLQPVYVKMLGYLRLNRASEALLTFNNSSSQISGKEYASLLIKWDEINPEELSEILISIQRAAREKRITDQKRRDEIMSDLVYLPVVLNVLIIIINFLYISYFLDQQEMLMKFL